ncbi:MAG: GIY-YIG nuclease family protein [Rhizomicrobium sp.]
MTAAHKKELVREYKERKTRSGIFAVRCVPDGASWTGTSRDLDSQQNGIWFQLRMGNHMNKALQQAWNTHGADAFRFEILETVEDDNAEMIGLLLKEREALWREQSGAAKLFG